MTIVERVSILLDNESRGRTPNLFLISLAIALAAFVLSLTASLTLYAKIAPELGNTRITDRYDELGRGLAYTGTLAYFPDQDPSVQRAPLFPGMLAIAFWVSGESFQNVALVLQSILHGLTVFAIFWLSFKLGNRKTAIVASISCALHPVLIWYSSRLIIEAMLTFLFTLMILAIVHYWQKPALKNALLIGLSIGCGLWCKAVFFPFLFLVPLLIAFAAREHGRRDAAVVLVTGLLLICPWLVRNYFLTDRFPVFQALVGYNLYVSDTFAEHASESPLGYTKLIEKIDMSELDLSIDSRNSGTSLARRESDLDFRLAKESLGRYLQEPLFLLKKIALNIPWFWFLGSRPIVTILLFAFQGVLLFLCARQLPRIINESGWWGAAMIPVWCSIVYVLPHVLVFSLGRFSVPLIPSLVTVAALKLRKA